MDHDANDKAIRQAYLRLSLRHHPDKNPDNPEQAKARFVEIGRAYEVLKDPVQRKQYDRQLRAGTTWHAAAAATGAQQEAEFETYADAFDAHVAGMTEAELYAAMGAASVVGSLIGGLVGGRIVGKGVLGTAGSLVGSAMASEAASSMVKSLHQASVERNAYRLERQAAMERGEEMPPIERRNWQDIVGQTVNSFKETVARRQSNDQTQSPRTSGESGERWRQAMGSVLNSAVRVKARMDQQTAGRQPPR